MKLITSVKHEKITSVAQSVLEQLIDVIINHKAVEKIVLFGSRSEGTNKKTSDIDIAVFGKNWSDTDINIVLDKLNENIRTPLKFDLLNYYSIEKKSLKESIEKGKVIYDRKKS